MATDIQAARRLPPAPGTAATKRSTARRTAAAVAHSLPSTSEPPHSNGNNGNNGNGALAPTRVAASTPASPIALLGAPHPASAHRPLTLGTRLLAMDLTAATLCWLGLSLALRQHDPAGPFGAWLGPGLAAAAATSVVLCAGARQRAPACRRERDELGRLVVGVLVGAAGFAVVESEVATARAQVLWGAGACLLAVALVHGALAQWLRARRATHHFLRPVLLVGANRDAARLRTLLHAEPELGYAVAGVVGHGSDRPMWDGLPAAPTVGDIPRLASATGATGVVLVPFAVSSAAAEEALALATAADLHVEVWPGIPGVGSRHLRSVAVSGEPFLHIEWRHRARWQLAAKRVIDVVGALVGIVLTWPVVVLAVVAVKLESPGPAFHRGERIGKDGRPFAAYKIRSMRVGPDLAPGEYAALNERTDGPLFKASRDPRVTRMGRVLRSSSVDELPQLWNVLTGTMSLVGPRPALPSEVAAFDDELQRRHSVRPGMTGLWQVEARHNPSFHAYRRLDLRYVDEWSLGLDLSIIAATFPSIASHSARVLWRALWGRSGAAGTAAGTEDPDRHG